MFRSIIDHRQLQVLHGEFELQLKLQCEPRLIHCRYKFKSPENVTTILNENKARANRGTRKNTNLIKGLRASNYHKNYNNKTKNYKEKRKNT